MGDGDRGRRPVNIYTFGGVELLTASNWSGIAISPTMPYCFTDVLQDYTLPNVRLSVVRVGSSRANYPVRGMLEDMSCSLTLTGHTPAVVGQVGAYLAFEFTADIEDDGLTPRDDAMQAEAFVRGWCNGSDEGQVQGPYNTPQTATVELQVVQYKLSLPSLSMPPNPIDDIYDIDLDIQKYLRHGVDLWRALG